MKNLKGKDLMDSQLCYLGIMYRRKLFPGTKSMVSGEIIGILVRHFACYFSDYSVGELVEDFYTLAQPWMIDVPLIDCKGNIGNPESSEYVWSKAASPCYTEAVLTEAGMKYVEENHILEMSFN